MGPVKSALNEKGIQISEFPVMPDQLGTIIKWVDTEIISQNVAAKQLFPSILSYPDESLDDLLEKLDVVKDDDQDLERIVKDVLENFPREVEMLKNGKNKLFGMFMGKIMQASKGGTDPKKANDFLRRLMNNK